MAKRRLLNQINIVPYVDVMLVLLVIFMVTAPLVNPGVVDLPSVAKSTPQTQVLPIEVTVRSDASLMIRERVKSSAGERTEERNVTTRELLDALHSLQSRNPEQPVVIAADKDVRYEAVMKVMDALQQANVHRVGLLVKPAAP